MANKENQITAKAYAIEKSPNFDNCWRLVTVTIKKGTVVKVEYGNETTRDIVEANLSDAVKPQMVPVG